MKLRDLRLQSGLGVRLDLELSRGFCIISDANVDASRPQRPPGMSKLAGPTATLDENRIWTVDDLGPDAGFLRPATLVDPGPLRLKQNWWAT